MSQCPVCGAEITEDFGIVECSGCQAQLIIHLDGRIEHAGSKSGEVTSEDEAIVIHQEILPEETPETFEFPQEEEEAAEFMEPIREFDAADFSEEIPEEVSDESSDDDATEYSTESPPPLPGEPISAVQEDAHDLGDPLDVLDSHDESGPSESYDDGRKKSHPVDSVDLADVAKFANSAESGGRDGSLRYTLFIEGIDTADVREAFKEAITDKKLLWDTENILRNIRKGEVKIENVSSAKAHIVVTRLKLLPVSVSWEQHAIHEG
jgi:hypothetical protein